MKFCNITAHAIEQFIRRWEPNKSAAQAEEEIQALFRTSKNIGRTRLGDAVVASSYRPEIRLVIKDRNVCVTVLPPGEQQQEEYELEMEERRRVYEDRVASIKQEITGYEKEIAAIDAERVLLAKKKSDLMNKITTLKNTNEYKMFG